MSNLTNLLRESKDKEFSKIKNSFKFDDGSEVLLLGAHDADKEMLNNLGLDYEDEETEVQKNVYLKTKKSEETYEMESFTGSQIKSLCLRYGLRISPVQEYKGILPKNLTKTLQDFSDKKGVEIRRDCFYVLSPVENFKKSNGKVTDKLTTVFFKEPNPYSTKLDNAKENDVFVQVMEWGTEYSFKDRFRPFFSDEVHNQELSGKGITFFIGFFSVLSLIAGVFFNAFLLSAVILVIPIIIAISQTFNNPSTDNLWNKLNSDRY